MILKDPDYLPRTGHVGFGVGLSRAADQAADGVDMGRLDDLTGKQSIEHHRQVIVVDLIAHVPNPAAIVDPPRITHHAVLVEHEDFRRTGGAQLAGHCVVQVFCSGNSMPEVRAKAAISQIESCRLESKPRNATPRGPYFEASSASRGP